MDEFFLRLAITPTLAVRLLRRSGKHGVRGPIHLDEAAVQLQTIDFVHGGQSFDPLMDSSVPVFLVYVVQEEVYEWFPIFVVTKPFVRLILVGPPSPCLWFDNVMSLLSSLELLCNASLYPHSPLTSGFHALYYAVHLVGSPEEWTSLSGIPTEFIDSVCALCSEPVNSAECPRVGPPLMVWPDLSLYERLQVPFWNHLHCNIRIFRATVCHIRYFRCRRRE